MLVSKSIHAVFATLLSLCYFINTTSAASAPFDDDPPDPYTQRSDASGRSVTTYAQSITQQLNSTLRQNADSTVGDDRALNTAQSKHASDPDSDIDWEHCGFDITDPSLPLKLRVAVCAYPPPETPESPLPEKLPTTREILYSAAAVIRADGAGLRKRPDGVSYTNRFVPTIVSVTNPTQTHVINLLGRDITITLTATNYEYSWGDGTPNTITTSRAWRGRKVLIRTMTRVSSTTTTPHPKAGAPCSMAPTPTKTEKSPSPPPGAARPPILSRGRPRRLTAWSPPPKQQAPSPYPTSSSTTPTPGKKNKATRPETTREEDAS